MRLVHGSALAVAFVIVAPTAIWAQAPPADANRVVAGGGISVPGWTGKIDAQEEQKGQALNNAKLAAWQRTCR